MSTKNKRTIYLGLDYTDFTGGVSEVNRKMGLLDAEFKLAQERVKNYGTETDNLGVKQDYLRQKIELQRQKVEAAKKAYDEALTSQQASEKQIDALDKRLLQERTSLEKLTGQLKEADDEIEKANKSTKSFGDEIRDLASDLGIKVSPALEKLAQKFDGVSAGVGNAVLGIGAMISGLVGCSVELAKYADDMLTMASVTGLSTDELQKLEYASNFVDVSLETMTGSITKLTQNMNQARNGNNTLNEAFRKLGIRIKDSRGELRDANEVFYESIDRLGKVKNETERDALAMQLFGKSAKELNPLIEAGSKRLKELGIEAENMGVIIGGETLQNAGAFNDAMDKWKQISEALKNSLGELLLPVLTKLAELISSIPAPVLKTIMVFGMFVASAVLILKVITQIKVGMSTLTIVQAAFGAVSKTTVGIVLTVVAVMIALAAVIAFLLSKQNELNETMENVNKQTNDVAKNVSNAQQNVYRTSNHASGTTNFAGGRTWVGEAGPELVTLPRGTKIQPAGEGKVAEYNTFYVTIDAKNVDDFNRVVELAKQQKVAIRRGTK